MREIRLERNKFLRPQKAVRKVRLEVYKFLRLQKAVREIRLAVKFLKYCVVAEGKKTRKLLSKNITIQTGKG